MTTSTTTEINGNPKDSSSEQTSPKNNEEKKMAKAKTAETTPQGAIQVAEPSRLPGNRPISSSGLVVQHTISASGIRPVAASGLQIADTISASGLRPITASVLHISGMLMGNRPIASNEIDDSANLMGFLD